MGCGEGWRSTSTTEIPRWPRSTARATPTGPPPTIATSKLLLSRLTPSPACIVATIPHGIESATTVSERSGGRPRSAHIDDAVLKATLRHLAERGYAGMSVNAIAAELGISKPTIYLRWPSKVDLA